MTERCIRVSDRAVVEVVATRWGTSDERPSYVWFREPSGKVCRVSATDFYLNGLYVAAPPVGRPC